MKFETGRHVQNLLTKAPPSGGYPKYLQIWDKQKSTFFAELIFGATSATGGRANFFVSCVNFLKNNAKCYIT